MREILFRGKDKDDGKWYEGAFRQYDDVTYCFESDYINHPENTHYTIMFTMCGDWNLPNQHKYVEVIPETVGQFIGLYDKNHKKIFEGDIVVAEYDDCITRVFEVIFYNCAFKLRSKHCQTMYDYSIHDEHPTFEVIGNIYDNPELLDVEK